MTQSFRVHFDGRVLVPEEPIDLPVGQSLKVVLESTDEPRSESVAGEGQSDDGAYLGDLIDWLDRQTPVERGDLPTDGARNYKHYLYGQPKQE